MLIPRLLANRRVNRRAGDLFLSLPFSQNRSDVFKLDVTAVPLDQLILQLTDQLRYYLYRAVDTVLGIELHA